MVKKIIACSDIHIRNLKRMDETYDMLNSFVEKCNSIKTEFNLDGTELRIVVAGDIFENKISVSNEANLAASWFLNAWSEVAVTYVICGNHDFLMNNKTRVDSLTPIISIANNNRVKYLDAELGYMSGTYSDDNIDWALFSSFDDFNKPNVIPTDPNNVVVGVIHGDINGATSDTNRVTENGLDAGYFEGVDFVIAGHIHKHQEIKKNGVKIVYCSSLIQQNHGESVHGHGFVLWDVEDKDYEFIELENPDYGFYKFSLNSIDDIENDTEILVNN